MFLELDFSPLQFLWCTILAQNGPFGKINLKNVKILEVNYILEIHLGIFLFQPYMRDFADPELEVTRVEPPTRMISHHSSEYFSMWHSSDEYESEYAWQTERKNT